MDWLYHGLFVVPYDTIRNVEASMCWLDRVFLSSMPHASGDGVLWSVYCVHFTSLCCTLLTSLSTLLSASRVFVYPLSCLPLYVLHLWHHCPRRHVRALNDHWCVHGPNVRYADRILAEHGLH